MSIYPDVQVESVTRDGYQIHDFDDIKVNEYMEFNADNNPGSYVVTLKTYNEVLQKYSMHEVKFNIHHKANSASDYFILSSGSGTGTIGTLKVTGNATVGGTLGVTGASTFAGTVTITKTTDLSGTANNSPCSRRCAPWLPQWYGE